MINFGWTCMKNGLIQHQHAESRYLSGKSAFRPRPMDLCLIFDLKLLLTQGVAIG